MKSESSLQADGPCELKHEPNAFVWKDIAFVLFVTPTAAGRERSLSRTATVPAADGQAACAKATPVSSSVHVALSVIPFPHPFQSVMPIGDERSNVCAL
jgi:hypothetical protein